MSLKELTAHKHREAEQTGFMQALMKNHLPAEVWTDFVYQKFLFYKTIEGLGGAYCGLNQISEIYRAFLLYQDYTELAKNQQYSYRHPTLAYNAYLQTLDHKPEKIMAHIYVWHMGDLFGGQMIKRFTPGKNLALQFEQKEKLISFIRSKCTDDMSEEAILAFDQAIKIMNEIF